MKRKDTQIFITEVKEMYGDEYSVLGEYKKNNIKIEMKHNICGYEYKALPMNILKGRKCPKCFKTVKKTTNLFKNELEEKYGDEYILLSEYVNNRTKVKVLHTKCNNIYEVEPRHLLKQSRCVWCAGNRLKTTESFKKEVEKLNSNIQIKGEYIGATKSILCECKICNYIFKTLPSNILKGHGCPRCSGNAEMDIVTIQEKMGKDYKVLEIKTNKRVILEHLLCGLIYETSKNCISQGCSCPKCASSKGEKEIRRVLKEIGIDFQEQYKFDDCKNKRRLPFDFYIKNKNICIEYDGEGHYEAFRYKGGKEKLVRTQENDKIKNNYCEKHNICLIRIPYYEYNQIETILKKALL